MDDSKITPEVLDELIAMIEDHFGQGMAPKAPESPEEMAAEGDPNENEPNHEASESESAEDEEDLKKLMEHYSRG